MKKIIVLCTLLLTVSLPILAKESPEEKVKQVKIGNFALPPSQQAGPMVGFGQNMLDQGNVQVYCYFDYAHSVHTNITTITPTVVYAIRDNASIFLGLPIVADLSFEDLSAHSVVGPVIQGEYAFFVKDTPTTANMITAVANITLPGQSILTAAAAGLYSPSFFLGLTASHVSTDWYLFTSYGATFPIAYHNIKLGKQFLYQWGLSKNICYEADHWLFNWMIELDGIYKKNDTIDVIVDLNTGGNQILLTPSLWFAKRHFFIQGGISAVVTQHLFGIQNKDQFHVLLNIGWTF